MSSPTLVDRLSARAGEKLSVVFLAAVILTAFEVVMRYVFNAPTIWVHDSAIALSAVGFVFGGAYALQLRLHIRISLVYDALPREIRRVLDVVNSVLIASYLAILLFAALRQALPSLELMETSGRAWDVPIPAFLKTVLAVGVALMLAQALVQLVAALRGRGGARP